MENGKIETHVIFRAAFKYVVNSQKRGLQARITERTNLKSSQIGDILSGRRKGSEDNRKDIVAAIEDFAKLGYTYSDMLNLGQWLLDGNKSEDWIQPSHANIKADLPAFGMKSTGTTEDKPPPEPSNVGPAPHPSHPPLRIPVISWVQAGDWHDAEDPFPPGQADEWSVTEETSSPRAFALVVHGDSMEPVFYENDIITVDPDLDPRNTDYIIAKNGEKATFKQLMLDGESVYLKPANERYPIKDMTGVDFVIVGVVIEKRKKFR